MEKRESILYLITGISFVFLIIISSKLLIKNPNTTNKKFMGLTGNVAFKLNENFKVGDKINGTIIVNSRKNNKTIYGLVLLTKGNESIIAKTFNLNETFSKGNIIKIEDLIDYKFEESGNYELLFSVLDLDINIKEGFIVE